MEEPRLPWLAVLAEKHVVLEQSPNDKVAEGLRLFMILGMARPSGKKGSREIAGEQDLTA
jgi:hypothetical protein